MPIDENTNVYCEEIVCFFQNLSQVRSYRAISNNSSSGMSKHPDHTDTWFNSFTLRVPL